VLKALINSLHLSGKTPLLEKFRFKKAPLHGDKVDECSQSFILTLVDMSGKASVPEDNHLR